MFDEFRIPESRQTTCQRSLRGLIMRVDEERANQPARGLLCLSQAEKRDSGLTAQCRISGTVDDVFGQFFHALKIALDRLPLTLIYLGLVSPVQQPQSGCQSLIRIDVVRRLAFSALEPPERFVFFKIFRLSNFPMCATPMALALR